MVNIYYEPDTVLSASHILIHIICTPFCYYPDVTTLQSSMNPTHIQNVVHILALLSLQTYHESMKNFIAYVIEVSGGSRANCTGRSNMASEIKKGDCLTVFLMTRWYCWVWEFSYMHWACVAWIFDQFQRMQDVPRLLIKKISKTTTI